MDRRYFVRAAGSGLYIASGGFAAALSGCGKSSTGLQESSGSPGSPGTQPKNPFQSYVPQVNSPPYPGPEYSLGSGVSDSSGIASVGGYTFFSLESGTHKPISGVTASFFAEDKYGSRVMYLADPQARYMPTIVVPPPLSSAPQPRLPQSPDSSSWPFVEMLPRDALTKLVNRLYVGKVSEVLPSYDPQKVDDYPGLVYKGDWSFNEVSGLTNLLAGSSKVLTILYPNPFTAAAYEILSTAGGILDDVGLAIDWINLFLITDPTKKIDKAKEYPIYVPGNDVSVHLILSFVGPYRRQQEDMKYLLPINVGNSWTFTDGVSTSTSSVLGTINVNGKDLLRIRNTAGIEEYYGFYLDGLYYYGFASPDIGNVFFDPAIKLGDSAVQVGSTYQTSSRIVFQSQPDASGSVTETISCSAREKVVLSSKQPYGDCFRMTESYNLQIINNGQTANASDSAQLWFAKNVGRVKVTSQQLGTVELLSATLKSKLGTSAPSLRVASEQTPRRFMPSLSSRIIEALRAPGGLAA